ncbi:MAG: transporter [Bacteroidetes bacterium]|nr:transporter [Bacteroidota bacterium]
MIPGFRIIRAAQLLILLLISPGVFASKINLDSCYKLAEKNYPQVKQFSLIEKAKEYSLENASRGYLPKLNIVGQATYQSAVTSIPISLPNVEIPTLSKDQYKIYGEITQPLTDLITRNDQFKLIEQNAEAEKQQIEVELQKIRERINQLYFGILAIDAQIRRTDLIKSDLKITTDKIKAGIENGVATQKSLDLLNSEILNVDQKVVELKASRKAFTQMLSLFTGTQIDENSELEIPAVTSLAQEIKRPELKLFDIRNQSFDLQNRLITAKNLPRFSLFVQTGYGRPTLNLLNNNFSGYYIGGLRMNWNISGFYTSSNERNLIDINRSILSIQRETFLFNTNVVLEQQNEEVEKLKELLKTDKELIVLRENIRKTASEELANGIITANDYIAFLNAENQAKQNLSLHEIQLLLAQYNYNTTSGN